MTTPAPTLRRLQRHHHDDTYRHSHDDNQRQRHHSDADNSVRQVGTQRATTQRHADWKFLGIIFAASTCKQLLTTPPRLLLAPTTTFRLLPTFSMGCSCRKRQEQDVRGLCPPPPRPHHYFPSPSHLLHGMQLQEAPGTRRTRPKSAGTRSSRPDPPWIATMACRRQLKKKKNVELLMSI